ncbi:MAG TPA: alpha/beta hydrolase-fold protein [Kineosporiaceae bacterium]|nr:alpha/beta hydrolase-fold protein [Kineosporiaceae bacterium]
MSLTGPLFLGLVVAATVASFVALVVLWPRLAGSDLSHVAARAGLLLGVNALVLLTAATQVNAQFLFFADWGDLLGALGGTAATTRVARGTSASEAANKPVQGPSAVAGETPQLPAGAIGPDGVVTSTVTGPLSGITGTVVVQLPFGYTDPANTSVRYPVIEAFQGYPGGPTQWIRNMNLGGVMADEVNARRMRPALIVAPQIEIPRGVDTECVDGSPGRPQLETWLTQDVPDWVARTFRVQGARSSWATIGLSAGGWCAAMAAMLHPAQYSAAIVMGGYFRPDFGPFYEPYPSSSPLAARYNLVSLADRSPPPVALWIETSHADPLSYGSSAQLLKTARPPLSVTATVLQHAGHRIGVWEGLVPGALAWLGSNVAGFRPSR